MKKLVIYILLLTIAFSFTACASSNQPVIDVKALEQQVAVDFAPQGRDAVQFFDFYYLGTDNGYHIVWFRLIGYEACDMPGKTNIEGYEFEVGGGCYLKAYKNGEFIDLRKAYYHDGLVSKEAIVKAGKLYAEQKNATE